MIVATHHGSYIFYKTNILNVNEQIMFLMNEYSNIL